MANLTHIDIQGYRSIESTSLALGQINLLIGTNGSGKSNFISVFKFLRQVVEQRLQATVKEAGGAGRLLHYGSNNTQNIDICLSFDPNYYQIKLATTLSDELFISEELAGFKASGYAQPFFEALSNNQAEARLKEKVRENIPRHVYSILKQWRVYHFHNTDSNAGIKKTVRLNDNAFLQENASNLAAFLYWMQEKKAEHFARITDIVKRVVPAFKSFYLRPDPLNEETIRLEWLSHNPDFIRLYVN